MTGYAEQLEAIKQQGMYRTLPPLTLDGKHVLLDGKSLLNLNSNDYLGLQDCPQLQERFLRQEGQRHPLSSASSRLLTGNDIAYRDFEKWLCEIYHSPSALVWDSGFHANSGIVPVLAMGNTLIIADRLIHASIVEGIKLSGAPFTRFRHNDLDHLEQLLQKNAGKYDRIWVITESVFSMDGDRAPLRELVTLKERYPGVCLYVDEAHGVGVFGEGLGLSAELGLLPQIDLLVGTLGKALGSVGAFTLQSETLRDLFVSAARPFIYSTALPPLNIAWSHYVFQEVLGMTSRRAHLYHLMARFSEILGTPMASPIHGFILPEHLDDAVCDLLDRGYYIRPIRKPTVPAGTERIRLSLTAALTEEEVTQLAHALLRWK